MSRIEEERNRAFRLEQEAQKRRTALARRKAQVDDDAAMALQVEASLIELSQENDLLEKQLQRTELALDAKREHTQHRRAELETLHYSNENGMRDLQKQQEEQHARLEDGWRQLEEDTRGKRAFVAAENARLQKILEELGAREAMLRERQRLAAEKEFDLVAQQRKVALRKDAVDSLAKVALERLQSELNDRENMLHQEL